MMYSSHSQVTDQIETYSQECGAFIFVSRVYSNGAGRYYGDVQQYSCTSFLPIRKIGTLMYDTRLDVWQHLAWIVADLREAFC